MTGLPLFDNARERQYPATAGFKEPSTSKDAARDITDSGRRGRLQEQVLASLVMAGPLTADEIANALGENILSIRPRFTELKRLGKIYDTGQRRMSNNGKRQKVYAIR